MNGEAHTSVLEGSQILTKLGAKLGGWEGWSPPRGTRPHTPRPLPTPGASSQPLF